MRQHTGEKPLQCGECKFSTRDPSVLHKHRQRHDSQDTRSSLKCSQCDYFCIQANALKRHMRLNHAEAYRDLCCDICSFTSINVERLRAHKQDHRQGLITNCEDSMDARAAGFKYPRKVGDKNGEVCPLIFSSSFIICISYSLFCRFQLTVLCRWRAWIHCPMNQLWIRVV